MYYCHKNHYQINSLGIFPGNVPVKNYRINCWGIFIRLFIAGFCSWNFGPSVMGSVNGEVFAVMGPNNCQINSLGIFSGTIRTEMITNENLEILFRLRFRNGKANKFPQIFFRICFHSGHVGHAQVTTTGHTNRPHLRIKIKSRRLSFAFLS